MDASASRYKPQDHAAATSTRPRTRLREIGMTRYARFALYVLLLLAESSLGRRGDAVYSPRYLVTLCVNMLVRNVNFSRKR